MKSEGTSRPRSSYTYCWPLGHGLVRLLSTTLPITTLDPKPRPCVFPCFATRVRGKWTLVWVAYHTSPGFDAALSKVGLCKHAANFNGYPPRRYPDRSPSLCQAFFHGSTSLVTNVSPTTPPQAQDGDGWMGEGDSYPGAPERMGCSWTHGVSRAGEAASDVEGMCKDGTC